MVSKTDLPQSVITAIQYFSKMETCIDFVASQRWPNGVICPVCGNKNVHYLSKQRRWKCRKKHKLQQFPVKVGTIFEDSPIGLDKWLIVRSRNGIPPSELAHDLAASFVLALCSFAIWFLISGPGTWTIPRMTQVKPLEWRWTTVLF